VKTSNFAFDKLIVAKREFVKLFPQFFINKKLILPNSAIFLIFANVFLGVDTPCGCAGVFHMKEVVIEVLAGPTPFSQII
jgi:hypothetical protein